MSDAHTTPNPPTFVYPSQCDTASGPQIVIPRSSFRRLGTSSLQASNEAKQTNNLKEK